ncbi:DUF354 domain-containing protein [Haloferax volcanii]|uniref:DUF354 domain-containing protein n=1 Tax=Haloferax volcanii TaxID=2246 RepID=UPI00349F7C11
MTERAGAENQLKVLFDIGHPAHVHLFKNVIKELHRDGHKTRVLSRDKEITITLLDEYEINHEPLSAIGTKKYSLITEWSKREIRTLQIAWNYDPDIIVSVASPPAAHASVLAGCPKLVFNDSEPAHLASKLTHPVSDVIYTPESFHLDLGNKQEKYPGYHELAYLHPNQFDPDPQSLQEFGVNPAEDYFVLRFVSWGAHHDVGHRGLSRQTKSELVSMLSEHGNVYITTEGQLPPEFEEFRLPVPPELMHHLLYYADLYVGDSQTMATEAALLGTPSVRSNSFAGDGDMGNFIELEERYDLLYSRSDESEMLDVVEDLVNDPQTTEHWNEKRDELMSEKIDVSKFMIDQIYKWGQNQ